MRLHQTMVAAAFHYASVGQDKGGFNWERAVSGRKWSQKNSNIIEGPHVMCLHLPNVGDVAALATLTVGGKDITVQLLVESQVSTVSDTLGQV